MEAEDVLMSIGVISFLAGIVWLSVNLERKVTRTLNIGKHFLIPSALLVVGLVIFIVGVSIPWYSETQLDILKRGVSDWNEWRESNPAAKVDLEYADLRGAYLSYADLRGANLLRANLSGLDLSYANLSEVELRYANLMGADLRKVDLSYADLRGANLRNANLSEANLYRAYLEEADYRGANLENAKGLPSWVR